MRQRRLSRLGLAPLVLVCLAPAFHAASAAWPPPESATAADMSDPANWPNDPSYGFTSDDSGSWNYYSFIPDVSTKVRPEETASGMSIDLAWRYTIGDPSVLIMVTDSGIKWDEDDLIESVYVNHRELANHKPTQADGSACGGTGELAGFDCNGDGILTVGDYTNTPTLEPPAQGGNPQGDKNANGRLDAGDLILNFSDGIDDDGNGYVDDISGWDFYKDDNDPYDDTRYGHGTGEARDSTAQAMNMIGSAGVCPKCRFVPARVGDSFITDSHDFGQAVIYAADNDVQVVQCALGTVNMTTFAQQALDYAYTKNVLAVTSMADENSRHPNVPATANHTLPVHAIVYDGSKINSSTTFVAFHPCSNFGGQNLLSASGEGCSSEATGRLSGITGLVYSAAKKYGISPPLTPGEVHSLFFTTTDDVDVPESQDADTIYRWSQPGFDQRFGYGRVNANKAVEAVKAKRIPPAVDVTSPRWFEVLYKDQVTGPIDIVGTVSAKRATSYDVVVEWAPGVQPLDDEFVEITSHTNLSSAMTLGEGGPLAQFDIRTIDVTHPRDVDSPLGENDYTITVRVRAVAHYGGAIGDVPGEMRRTYFVYEDPDLLPGFPYFIGDSGEGHPKLADIDGDGVRELLYPSAGGELHVLRITQNGPEPLPGFPFVSNPIDGSASPPPTPTTPVYGGPGYAVVDTPHEAFESSPAIADLDGDGTVEIVITSYSGTVYVVEADGSPRAGWPKRLPEVPSCPLDPSAPKPPACMDTVTRIARGAFAAPVLEDMDGDGKYEIIQAAMDGKVYIWDADGADLPGWPVLIHYPDLLTQATEYNRIMTTPAVADFNGDGIPDLVVGSNERLGGGGSSGAVYLVDGRGNNAPKVYLPNWPVSMTSFEIFPLVAEGVPNAPLVGKFDGVQAAVMHGNATLPLILPLDPGAQGSLTSTPPNAIPSRPDPIDPNKIKVGVDSSSIFGIYSKAYPDTMLPLFSQPSLGDLDQDGVPDVIASGGSLGLAISLQSKTTTGRADQLVTAWSGKTGAMMPGAPFVLEDFTFFNSQAVVDLNGDDYPEVVTGSGAYYVHAWDACGREAEGFPKFTGGWVIPTTAFGDLDGDGGLEMVTGTRHGWIYAWHTAATTDSIVEWESYHHDNRNTGNYDVPLEQGKKTKAAKPLDPDSCKEPVTPPPPNVDVVGGCTCQAPATGAPGGLAALALGLVALGRRRRARA